MRLIYNTSCRHRITTKPRGANSQQIYYFSNYPQRNHPHFFCEHQIFAMGRHFGYARLFFLDADGVAVMRQKDYGKKAFTLPPQQTLP